MSYEENHFVSCLASCFDRKESRAEVRGKREGEEGNGKGAG